MLYFSKVEKPRAIDDFERLGFDIWKAAEELEGEAFAKELFMEQLEMVADGIHYAEAGLNFPVILDDLLDAAYESGLWDSHLEKAFDYDFGICIFPVNKVTRELNRELLQAMIEKKQLLTGPGNISDFRPLPPL